MKDGESPSANCFYSPYLYNWDGRTLYIYYPGYGWYEVSGNKLPYSSLQKAFWFAAANNGSKVHICDLSEGSYWPYKDANGRERPNHS